METDSEDQHPPACFWWEKTWVGTNRGRNDGVFRFNLLLLSGRKNGLWLPTAEGNCPNLSDVDTGEFGDIRDSRSLAVWGRGARGSGEMRGPLRPVARHGRLTYT